MGKQYALTVVETDTETDVPTTLVDMTGEADIVALNGRFIFDKIAPRPKPGRKSKAAAESTTDANV